MLYNECESGKTNWVSKIRDMLNVTGFNFVWLYPQSVVTNVFVPLLIQRLKDTCITEWRRGIETSPTMLMFKNLKPTFEISQYLLTVSNVKLRQYITAIRLSSHNLLIEYGRHRNIPRNERHCNKCTNNNGSLEDEYHFVIVCNAYHDLRTQYISTYYYRRPSMY